MPKPLFAAAGICILAVNALAGPLGDAAKKGDVAEIRRLLAEGADPNEADAFGTPLHWAAMNGHAEVIALLKDGGADIEAPSDHLGRPLHAAAGRGHVAAIEALLAGGADPDTGDKDGFTPLMRAAHQNRLAALEALITGGADVHAIGTGPGGNEFGNGPTNALHLALAKGNSDVAAVLRAAGAGPITPAIPEDLPQIGDPARGLEHVETFCTQCHAIDADAPPKTGSVAGPPLHDLVGRQVASIPEFDYSDALIEYGGAWTPERIYAFVLQPMLTVPGTRMRDQPVHDEVFAADIVAYFSSAE